MKKTYLKPTMQVVHLQHQHQLLTGSPLDSVDINLDKEDDFEIDDTPMTCKEKNCDAMPQFFFRRYSSIAFSIVFRSIKPVPLIERLIFCIHKREKVG